MDYIALHFQQMGFGQKWFSVYSGFLVEIYPLIPP